LKAVITIGQNGPCQPQKNFISLSILRLD